MTSEKQITEILQSKSQLRLYGYQNYFKSFIKLHNENRLPNIVLLSGPKGLGKSTFAYHFINYLLSQNEKYEYSVENFQINPKNYAFNQIQNYIHPNFFLLEDNQSEENIKIDQIRSLIKFLNKSTYAKNLKIILLDNVEYLNHYSSNALLKSLEEPSKNTFFFIIHNNSSLIPDTIKSRCIQFKMHFNFFEKRNIFNKIIQNYEFNFNKDNLNRFLYFDTPGNYLKRLVNLNNLNFNFSENDLSCILFLIEKYKAKKDHELLNFITLLIENFYNELSLRDSENSNIYSNDKTRILYLIYNMKKFNLDKKNLLISIDEIIKNAN